MNGERTAWLIARALGDVKAARKGPDVLVRRLMRRAVTRRMFRLFGNGSGR